VECKTMFCYVDLNSSWNKTPFDTRSFLRERDKHSKIGRVRVHSVDHRSQPSVSLCESP
jgi:hypothetical protein